MSVRAMVLNGCAPLAVLALCLHPALASTRQPDLDGVIAQINDALAGVHDLSCTMVEQFDPAWEAPVRSLLQLEPPDRVRLTTTDEHGNERIIVKNGNLEWRIMDPRSVSKTVWTDGGVPADSPVPVLRDREYRFLRDAVSSSKNSVLGRLDYRGVEPIDGEPCHVFATRNGDVLTWIAAHDGLIRRQELRVAGGRHVTRFEDIEVNAGLDDALFAFEPEEGARVEVAELVDGEWRRDSFEVPFEAVPADAQRQAHPRLAEVRARFERNDRFSCRLLESYVAHAAYAVTEDGERIPIGHRRQGTLVVEPPLRVRLEITEETTGLPIRRDVLVICDGETVWRCDRDADAHEPRVVTKDRLLPLGALLQPGRAEEALLGELPHGHDLAVDVPPFVLSPLGGIGRERVAFAGEEIVAGVLTYRFEVKANDREMASTHWIGAKDGIPRRVELRNVLGNVVETTIELDDVRLDPELADGTFTHQDDGTSIVMDMAEVRGGWGVANVEP